MKPFLILQLRPIDVVSDNEFEAFLKYGGLKPSEAHRVRMDQGDLPQIDLNDYSGVILGGGPSNVSDDPHKKPAYQQTFEAWLWPLLEQIIQEDKPFFGACYGFGALIDVLGGEIGKGDYAENVEVYDITLTPAGQADPLLQDIPKTFSAVAGHKESCQTLPERATLLARSDVCPVHMIRVGRNVYATQFHAELDGEGICLRIDAYLHEGYFPVDEAEDLKQRMRMIDTPMALEILKRFVRRYRS